MGSKHGKPVLREEDVKVLAKSSGLDDSQVKASFNAFIADYPDGKLNPNIFREMMMKALPKKDASKMDKHVFRMYDSDEDGFIDFTEFMTTLHILGGGTEEELLQKVFRVFNVNDDDSISMEEMNKLAGDMHALLTEKDQHVGSIDYITAAAIVEMDKNKDGKITVDEFTKACKNKKETSWG